MNMDNFFHGVIKKKDPIENDYPIDDDVDLSLATPSNFEDEPTTPGKLDLSQFNNITNAIGKLHIQSKPNQQAQQSTHRLQPKLSSQPSQPTDILPQDSGFFKNRGKKYKTRAKDFRQNHGRAVAPPQLPGETPFLGSKLIIDGDLNKFPSVSGKYTHLTDNDNDIDSNLSPIAKRLLRTTPKDHKVSELANSPCESDNEIQIELKHISRKQKPYRGASLAPDYGSSSVPSCSSVNHETRSFSSNNNNNNEEFNSDRSSLEEKIRNLDKLLASKPPPGMSGIARYMTARSSSLDQENVYHNSTSSSLTQINDSKNDKDIIKKDKKKMRDDEKMEKRRLKEEEKQRKEEKRQEKKLASKKSKSNLTMETITEEGVPFFIKRCIQFIEAEGLDAEGIYRVPGNRAHVDAFVQKFKENPLMSINECDIPVNAVATALKDFLSKKWGPIIPTHLMDELTDISSKSVDETRVHGLKELVNQLPLPNYKLLKYVFSHFVK